jgi:hypothetical protein
VKKIKEKKIKNMSVLKTIVICTFLLGVGLLANYYRLNNNVEYALNIAGADSTATGIYNASSDFSATQGYRGWYYLDTAGNQLSYDTTNRWWIGNENNLIVSSDGNHPGQKAGSVRRWLSPISAKLRIVGNVHDMNVSCGSGVTALINKGTTTVWTKNVANNNKIGFYFDFDVSVNAGESIDFIVTKGSDSNGCDSTYFDYYIAPITSSALCVDCIEYKVGPAKKISGPAGIPIDSVVQLINVGGKLVGYTANGTTMTFQGTNFDNLALNSAVVIGPGPTGSFDVCGAWLQGLAFNDNIKGWYHAETACAPGQTHKSVAYAESNDAGKTFIKPNYPNNQVLKGSTSPQVGMHTGAGDQTVIRWGNNYYMYFLELSDWGFGVAKSSVADQGKPGTWYKWFNNSFSTPALDKDYNSIGYFGPSVSHNASYDALSLITMDKWFQGLRLSHSYDGVNFTSMDDPLLIVEDEDWVRDAADKELVVYPSVSTPALNSWRDGFYLFYTYLQPGEDFSKRYLVVRKVDVANVPNKNAADPQVKVEFSNYYSSARKDTWSTNTMTPADYVYQKSLGYLYTRALTGTVTFFDCYNTTNDDHFVGVDNCGTNKELRKLGYIWSAQQPNSVPVFSCYDAANVNRFVSLDPNCEGSQNELTLGYIEQFVTPQSQPVSPVSTPLPTTYVSVTSPNTAVSWLEGSTQSIKWNHNIGLDTYVKIELSRNNGSTWEVIAPSVKNSTVTTGTYTWVVSGPPATQALIRVSKADGTVSDVGDVPFIILAPSTTVTSPNTALNWAVGSTQNIKWNHNMGATSYVKIEVSRDAGSTWELITDSFKNTTSSTGLYFWTVSGPVTSQARIRVSTTNGQYGDISNVNFTIAAPYISVAYPNTASTIWTSGVSAPVRWTHNLGILENVKIELSLDGGVTYPVLLSTSTVSDGTENYIPVNSWATNIARVKISWAKNGSVFDVSDYNYVIKSVAQLTYGPSPTYTHYFGQNVLHEDTWDRYLMFVSINSSIVNGKPNNTTPGDAGTYNDTCQTWWGDRIWLTWHLGDGKSLAGWNATDSSGTTPPLLMLNIGGAGESALIGDPSVVFWNNQWHMYYEGTDDCTGNNNKIFHATAPDWSGPWTKQGQVTGLAGNISGSGLSWPTVFVELGKLYLYYTDGNVRLYAAEADSTGQAFTSLNSGNPVSPALINRGQVWKENSKYYLIADNFGRTTITEYNSTNKLLFPSTGVTRLTKGSTNTWSDLNIGLPSFLLVGTEHRLYYSGDGSAASGIGVITW